MENRKLRIGLIVLLCFAFFTCKKEQLQPGDTTTNTPVFYFKGIVNNLPVNLQAGVGNYYMFSYCSADNNNVLNFSGTLEQTGCTGCANSLGITIKDYTVENNASSPSFFTGYYAYSGPSGGSPTSWSATFSPRTYDTASTSYGWNFGDGNTSNSRSPSHIYSHPGNYNVLLNAEIGSSCGGSISEPLNLGTALASLYTKIVVAWDSSHSLSLRAYASGGTKPYKYFWNFGDGDTSYHQNIIHVYTADSGLYQISLTVADSAGHTTTVALDTITLGYSKNCIVNFGSYVYPIANPNAFSNIIITYTDASGDAYSSANVIQPTSSFFQVQSIANYQNNQNNQPTKELQVNFNCMVQDSKGNSIPITNGSAVIAVAYK